MKDKTCSECKSRKAIAYSRFIGSLDTVFYCQDCLRKSEAAIKKLEEEIINKYGI